MAQQLDWLVLPNNLVAGDVLPSGQHTYDLFTLTDLHALCYKEREWGINLSWCDPTSTDNIRFQKQAGTADAIKFDEPIAINVRGGKWLVHQKRDTGFGVGWSESPKFEWTFKGEAAGTKVVSGNQVGLFNSVERDYMMYDPRDWGINLKWFKDSGKFNGLTKAKKSLPGQAIAFAGKKLL